MIILSFFFAINVCHVQALKIYKSDHTCSICCEDETDPPKPMIKLKKCEHEFCYKCIDMWANSGSGNAHKCPLCRDEYQEFGELHRSLGWWIRSYFSMALKAMGCDPALYD